MQEIWAQHTVLNPCVFLSSAGIAKACRTVVAHGGVGRKMMFLLLRTHSLWSYASFSPHGFHTLCPIIPSINRVSGAQC